jgi:signal recognition particle subunit SEC65
MDPKNLKRAIMQLKTKNGHIIRDYYIDLEELLKLYVEYTLYFNHRESQRKITDLEQTMAEMRLERKQDRNFMRSLGISLEEVKDQNETLIDQNEELLDNNKGLKKDVKKVQRKLGIAVEDRAPLPEDHGPKDHDRDPALPDRDEDKQERFVLLKRNDDEHHSSPTWLY